MESHRILIALALFAACAFAVDAAAIENAPAPQLMKTEEAQPQAEDHHRTKKFITAYSGYGYASSYGYYPYAYSAPSYYAGYRSLPYSYYTPYTPYYYF